MVPEAPQEETEQGRVTTGEGWFVLNARDARWYHAEGRSAICEPEGDSDFVQLGLNLTMLEPGVPMAMYHWESDQEDFLVLAGEAVLVVEGEERPLRQWDFVHCPPLTKHVLVGAGDRPCVILAVGSRAHQGGPDWGGYSVDGTAARHGASVERETSDANEAYAEWARRSGTPYREGWLPR